MMIGDVSPLLLALQSPREGNGLDILEYPSESLTASDLLCVDGL